MQCSVQCWRWVPLAWWNSSVKTTVMLTCPCDSCILPQSSSEWRKPGDRDTGGWELWRRPQPFNLGLKSVRKRLALKRSSWRHACYRLFSDQCAHAEQTVERLRRWQDHHGDDDDDDDDDSSEGVVVAGMTLARLYQCFIKRSGNECGLRMKCVAWIAVRNVAESVFSFFCCSLFSTTENKKQRMLYYTVFTWPAQFWALFDLMFCCHVRTCLALACILKDQPMQHLMCL